MQSLKTFWALLYKEVVVFKSDHLRVVTNGFIWFTSVLVPVMFFLPSIGLPSNYSQLMVPAGVVSWGLFDIISNATSMMSDILGDRVIEHELILPLPQWAVFVKVACANAYCSFVSAIIMLPFGMFIVTWGTGFYFSNFCFLKSILMLTLSCLFFGFLGLFATSFMAKVSDVRNLWMRVLFPLWYMGGFHNNWSTIYKSSPLFAHVMLLNPLMYATEGMRAAVLGQEGYINFWYCFGILTLSTLVCGAVAIMRLQKRLDCL